MTNNIGGRLANKSIYYRFPTRTQELFVHNSVRFVLFKPKRWTSDMTFMGWEWRRPLPNDKENQWRNISKRRSLTVSRRTKRSFGALTEYLLTASVFQRRTCDTTFQETPCEVQVRLKKNRMEKLNKIMQPDKRDTSPAVPSPARVFFNSANSLLIRRVRLVRAWQPTASLQWNGAYYYVMKQDVGLAEWAAGMSVPP